jgi:hypothetical protein
VRRSRLLSPTACGVVVHGVLARRLEEHAIELADFLLTLKQHALHTLPEHMRQAGVHFVTHSCGALVLRSALHRIAYDDMGCRVVMLAPTNRGCSLLRRLGSGDANILLKTVTRTIVGDMFGRHLTRLSPEQAARTIPPLPAKYPALVVVGTENLSYGTPFLPGNEKCDGVVLESETRLDTPAVYAHVHATHTLMLYHPTTLLVTSSFLKEPSSFFL